jgi:aspartate/methionine/tyrosine aminotransferase
MLARARELEASGREIIYLEIGQPDFETFDNIWLAGLRTIAEGKNRLRICIRRFTTSERQLIDFTDHLSPYR